MTLEEMIVAIIRGTKRIDSSIYYDNKEFDVKVYAVGDTVRVDLKRSLGK
jgi:hypothetical protein